MNQLHYFVKLKCYASLVSKIICWFLILIWQNIMPHITSKGCNHLQFVQPIMNLPIRSPLSSAQRWEIEHVNLFYAYILNTDFISQLHCFWQNTPCKIEYITRYKSHYNIKIHSYGASGHFHLIRVLKLGGTFLPFDEPMVALPSLNFNTMEAYARSSNYNTLHHLILQKNTLSQSDVTK